MTRKELFRQASTSVETLRQQFPDDSAIEQIAVQLTYLTDLQEGKRADRRHLENITIGVLTVREIEPLSSDVAELLYKIVEEVEAMKNERPVV